MEIPNNSETLLSYLLDSHYCENHKRFYRANCDYCIKSYSYNAINKLGVWILRNSKGIKQRSNSKGFIFVQAKTKSSNGNIAGFTSKEFYKTEKNRLPSLKGIGIKPTIKDIMKLKDKSEIKDFMKIHYYKQ